MSVEHRENLWESVGEKVALGSTIIGEGTRKFTQEACKRGEIVTGKKLSHSPRD